jgi:uncharacterized protein YndB with AHSA1/START domain
MADEFATEVDLPAPAEEVFRHLTDPAAMIRWMGQHAVLKPAPGGAFEVDINGVPVRGQYLEIDPPRRSRRRSRHRSLWTWPTQPAANPAATAIAVILLIAGASAVAITGADRRRADLS